eukprot:COSAG06_NODE_2762_length_6327_cov_5.664740_8_plen_268_part_00
MLQNHWDHVVSKDLVHWKRLPSPVRPGTAWYDSHGSFDGSAAILPGRGPVILVDNIGPFTPPNGSLLGSTDNPGCQGLSWPVDPVSEFVLLCLPALDAVSIETAITESFDGDMRQDDPELTHWRKDAKNPLVVDNLPCGSKQKNTAGAFPGSIFKTGDHFNYLSFGFRFTSTDPSLHEWHMVEDQFLSNASKKENGGVVASYLIYYTTSLDFLKNHYNRGRWAMVLQDAFSGQWCAGATRERVAHCILRRREPVLPWQLRSIQRELD